MYVVESILTFKFYTYQDQYESYVAISISYG